MTVHFLKLCGVFLLAFACNERPTAEKQEKQPVATKGKPEQHAVLSGQPAPAHAGVIPENNHVKPLQPPREAVPAAPTTFDLKSVQKHVAALDVQPSQEVWSRISWVDNLPEAKLLSAQTKRPIFFFSMHGKLDGRC